MLTMRQRQECFPRSQAAAMLRNGTLSEVAYLSRKAKKSGNGALAASNTAEMMQMALALHQFRLNGVFPANEASAKLASMIVARKGYSRPLGARIGNVFGKVSGAISRKAYAAKEFVLERARDLKETFIFESKEFGKIMRDFVLKPVYDYALKPVLTGAIFGLKAAGAAAGLCMAGVGGALLLEEIKPENTQTYRTLERGYAAIADYLPLEWIGGLSLALIAVGSFRFLPKMLGKRKF